MRQAVGKSGSDPLKIAVLMGGPSAEREVSLSSGEQVCAALSSLGHDVHPIDAGKDLGAQLLALVPDLAFNALHGRWGEDGCVQGLLEWLNIPYTHSGVMASAIAMDKTRTKEIYAAAALPFVPSVIARREDVMASHLMPVPYVVKPNNEGSSVGVYLVADGANGPPHLSDDMPDEVMVEAYADGRELTVTVMGYRVFAVTDIFTDGFYDYDAKYVAGGSRHVVPANIPDEITKACQDYALRAHAALGCRGVSRTDFRWDEARGIDGIILLETNTQPGMTPTSLSPEQAQHAGLSYAEFCEWMVRDASCNR